MSGGGPELGRTPQDETTVADDTCRFKRYVAPDTVRIDGLPNNTDEILYVDTKLTLKRPLLGYPSVVFTGKYDDRPDHPAAGRLRRRVGQAACRTGRRSASPTRMWTASRSPSSCRP